MKIFTTFKRVAIIAIISFYSQSSFAQNTAWSTTGNIGIGTNISGFEKLTIRNNSAQLRLESSSEPNNYYTRINSNYSYPNAFSLTVKGGTTERDLITWGEETGMTFRGGFTPRFSFSGTIRTNDGGTQHAGKLEFGAGDVILENSLQTFKINHWNGASYLNSVTIVPTGNVLIGKTSQLNSLYKLDIAGKIRADEIVVNTTGADFVFSREYNLRPLSEVEKFIQENQHLPEIPSALEMQTEGASIGELQTKLLQKVEELTLYMIEMKKENEMIKKENADIKAKNETLALEIQQLKTK